MRPHIRQIAAHKVNGPGERGAAARWRRSALSQMRAYVISSSVSSKALSRSRCSEASRSGLRVRARRRSKPLSNRLARVSIAAGSVRTAAMRHRLKIAPRALWFPLPPGPRWPDAASRKIRLRARLGDGGAKWPRAERTSAASIPSALPFRTVLHVHRFESSCV